MYTMILDAFSSTGIWELAAEGLGSGAALMAMGLGFVVIGAGREGGNAVGHGIAGGEEAEQGPDDQTPTPAHLDRSE